MSHIRSVFAILCGVCLSLCVLPACVAGDANRFAYLDDPSPYYPHRDFPRFVTPQWVGDPGVEAVVVLAIDDMREPPKYEAFLRPILQRLKQIDGRAPVSIMTCQVDPKDPQLQSWLDEGLSLEIHTVDHPCPLFAGGDFRKAKSTFDRCVDLMAQIPGNHPVAFRTPCCDSLNTVSPRFFATIFNARTPQRNFLTIDSSVFNVITSDDPELPAELTHDADGSEKFAKYLPKNLPRNGMVFNTFVNTIENYPYPYLINQCCWEFPCATPSDWSAQHLQKPNNPKTLSDLKTALDAVVKKRGVFNLVFHPHGWIENRQVVDLIDHAVQQHGSKVKFLTFREANDRLNAAFGGIRFRENGRVLLLDANGDGYCDALLERTDEDGEKHWTSQTWSPETQKWSTQKLPCRFNLDRPSVVHAGVLTRDGLPSVFLSSGDGGYGFRYTTDGWQPDQALAEFLDTDEMEDWWDADEEIRRMVFRDVDRDGISECLANAEGETVILKVQDNRWTKAKLGLPAGTTLSEALRFVDIDEDGHDDVLYSDDTRYSLHLFDAKSPGWTREIVKGTRGQKPADQEIPSIAVKGKNNGFFVHDRMLVWQNENTDKLVDMVDRRSFDDLLGHADAGAGAKSAAAPAAGLKSMHARPGFKVEQMAAEPLTMDPVAFAWGPDGKLWVVEMADYPLGIDGKGKPGGRVRYLEDTDGDGRYDRSVLFMNDVPYPTGVLPWKNGVLVSAAPDVFFAADTDGDGKADQREVLYTGFVQGNQQHRVNGLVWGLDNWIHCANGDSGGGVKSMKTGEVVEIRGRDLRIRPDNGAIEAETGQTQFGRCQDDWGNWFGCNNSNPMYQFVLEDRYLRRNPHYSYPDPRVMVSETPGAAPVFPRSRTLERFNNPQSVNQFTSACSVMVYRDTLFGPDFAGNSFVSEPVHDLVHREVMRPEGVTFVSKRAPDEQQSEFLASTDNWSRPTMIRTGPDGALWVADMYRAVIEHPEWIPLDWQKRIDLRAGHEQGRIYRVFPVTAKPRAIPRLDRMTTAELIAALDSPNGWQRDTAQQLLIERGDQAAVPLLTAQARSSGNPLCRLHSLCTLDGLRRLDAILLQQALVDGHPGVRRHAIRLCENLPERPSALVAALSALATDADPHVRLQLAATLGFCEGPQAAEALAQLAWESRGDRFVFAYAMSSVGPNNWETMARVFLQQGGAAGAQPAIDAIVRMAPAFGGDDSVARLISAIAQPAASGFAPWQFTAAAALLDALQRQSRSIEALLKSEKPPLQQAAKKLPAVIEAARAAIAGEKTQAEMRLAAVPLLGRDASHRAQDLELLGSLLVPQSSIELQQAVVAALGNLPAKEASQQLVKAWRGATPAVRGQVLDRLLANNTGRSILLTAIEEKSIPAIEIDAVRRQRLLQSNENRERAMKLFATTNSDRTRVLEQYRSALELTGDAARGAQLFAKSCAQCHRLKESGHAVGPDLAALTDKSPESLLVAMIDPNRALESKFIAYTAVTRDGKSTSGMLASETGGSITLVGPEAKSTTIPRDELEELVSSSKSLMPEGLENDLKPQDIADLLAMLRADLPAAAPKSFPGNQPKTVAADDQGVFHLKPATCEIYGPSVILESQYGNLGYWGSADDRAVWTVQVPEAGRYEVWGDWACETGTAGKVCRVESLAGALLFTVEGTGTWDDYRQQKWGELILPAGKQRITVRSEGKLRGAMIDLRGLELRPVKR